MLCSLFLYECEFCYKEILLNFYHLKKYKLRHLLIIWRIKEFCFRFKIKWCGKNSNEFIWRQIMKIIHHLQWFKIEKLEFLPNLYSICKRCLSSYNFCCSDIISFFLEHLLKQQASKNLLYRYIMDYIQYAHNIEASNEYRLLNQIDVSVSRNDAIYVRCIVRIQWKSLLSTFLHSMVMLKHCIKHSDCLVI